ncbi:MAG: hypothetical protein B7Y02_14965 [Rhodobacterales bacterium 17-64-5]|nr:MAG: hypothetical protein B7Y02_14965 [Rhodobacterales bacterium 17-64-5]
MSPGFSLVAASEAIARAKAPLVKALSLRAAGLVGVVKSDRIDGAVRRMELWQGIGADVADGDTVRVIAGCNKSATTCRTKFGNFPNFRGFPHIPGEDWLASYPVSDRANTGAARTRAGG